MSVKKKDEKKNHRSKLGVVSSSCRNLTPRHIMAFIVSRKLCQPVYHSTSLFVLCQKQLESRKEVILRNFILCILASLSRNQLLPQVQLHQIPQCTTCMYIQNAWSLMSKTRVCKPKNYPSIREIAMLVFSILNCSSTRPGPTGD